MITKTSSYINAAERIIYTYLSPRDNLQTLVGTRYWVLGTQVLLMILKQKSVLKQPPTPAPHLLLSRVPFYGLRGFRHMPPWGPMLG